MYMTVFSGDLVILLIFVYTKKSIINFKYADIGANCQYSSFIMKHNVALVCDFFYPNVGGVENHIFQLAQSLMARGHKVVVITHSYQNKVGLHHLTGLLRVYYLPLIVFYNQSILPTIVPTLPQIRTIMLAENITIVHGHSSFSALAHEAIFHAKTLGIRTVFTDHSLFGFADGSSIITNKLLELTLSGVNHVICVSHTSKENTCLRAKLFAQDISVIPNAIDPTAFIPSNDYNKGRIKVVVMSRLVYRKGMDLLAEVIPRICKQFDYVDFIIGGDGPKRLLLDEMCENHVLHNRVTFLGTVKHEMVPSYLQEGDVFLNTSLTETFCIAILEAACCGLQVVSTNVGGVREVLPSDVIHLSEPNVPSLVDVMKNVITLIKEDKVATKAELHKKVAPLYTWSKVAARTEKVYDYVISQPLQTLDDRLGNLTMCGRFIGRFFCLLALMDCFLSYILDWIQPIRRKPVPS